MEILKAGNQQRGEGVTIFNLGFSTHDSSGKKSFRAVVSSLSITSIIPRASCLLHTRVCVCVNTFV